MSSSSTHYYYYYYYYHNTVLRKMMDLKGLNTMDWACSWDGGEKEYVQNFADETSRKTATLEDRVGNGKTA